MTNRICRVLFVDHTATMGGGEIAMLRLIRSLDHRRYCPVVLLFSDGPLAVKLRAERIETHILPLASSIVDTRKDSLGIRSLLQINKAFLLAAYIGRVARFIGNAHIDVVHANSLKSDVVCGVAGFLAGVKVIWHVRDRIASDYLPSSAAKAFRFLCRVLPSYVIANSRATLATVGPKVTGSVIASGSRPRRMQLVHDGMAHSETAIKSGPVSRDGLVRIGLVGRISPWKGQHVFIEAAAKVARAYPQARFQIIGKALFGEKAYDQKIRALVSDLHLQGQVEFCGFSDDVAAMIDQLDILVHASTLPEPFGQVVIEGMAARKPVIATNGGGIPDIIVDGESGLLVPMKDVDAMAGAIIRLIDNPELATKIAESGYKRFEEHFTIEKTAASVQAVYDRLLTRTQFRDGAGNTNEIEIDPSIAKSA